MSNGTLYPKDVNENRSLNEKASFDFFDWFQKTNSALIVGKSDMDDNNRRCDK